MADRQPDSKPSVLFVAPFDRGLESGGSQRATAVAEALEDRGFTTGWHKPATRPMTVASRLAAAAVGDPDVVRHFDPRLPSGSWDVVLVGHSYLARCLDHRPPGSLPVVDFHNLEWQQLKDMATVLPPPKSWHYRLQARRMAAFEAGLTRTVPVTCFTSEVELEWARSQGGSNGGLVVPNILPRATAAVAARVWGQRAQRAEAAAPAQTVLYVGTLDFLPNFESLRRFINDVWPAVAARQPDSRLVIAGRVLGGRERELEGPGVEVLGYVEDLNSLMVECRAAVMPLTSFGGTSLRVLWYALAGVPMVGSDQAFRGYDPPPGLVATTEREWVEHLAACIRGEDAVASTVAAARCTAVAVNGSPAPWDQLAERLERPISSP